MTAIRKCNKCGIEAYSEKDLDLFTINKQCKYNRENRCRTCANIMKKEIHNKNKKELIMYLGGECNRCGIEYNNLNGAIFQFHHTDPTKKDYSPSSIMHHSLSKIHKEVAKCILLCANCHQLEHSGEY